MAETLTMRVSLAGVAANAADALMRLATEVRELTGYDPADPGEDRDDPAGDAEEYVYMLRELSKHARQTAAGLHSIEMFADFYALAGPAVKWAGEPNTARSG